MFITIGLFLIFIYSIGFILSLIFLGLENVGRIRVYGRKHLFGHSVGVFIVSNHPSLLEIFLIPILFFPQFLIRPFHFFPWGVGDPKVFIDNWYYVWMRIVRFVAVSKRETDPNDHTGRIRATFRKVKKILEKNQIVEYFPEGGRTCKRKLFVANEKGYKLGKLKRGFEELQKTFEKPYVIIPLWISGTDIVLPVGKIIPRFHKSIITIKIGEPILVSPSQIINCERMEQILIQTADMYK